MKKIAIIVSSTESDWISCKVITPNLLDAYKKNKKIRTTVFHFSQNASQFQAYKVVKEIKANEFDQVVFLDHQPHPIGLLSLLDKEYKKTDRRPDIIFHIYGCFSLYTREWKKMAPILKKYNVKFVCASHRQKDFVGQFLKKSNRFMEYCPFPVQKKVFHFDEKLREDFRAELNIKDNEISILYTGRISRQKNVIRLMEIVQTFSKLSKTKVKLYIAGPIDDMGEPFVGRYSPQGDMFETFLKRLERYKQDPLLNIIYLGKLNADELSAYYNACDLYASLSTHNDEDYGMSPAEALCCGQPVMLSNWGGFASFVNSKEAGRLIDVQVTETGPAVKYQQLVKELISFKNSKLTAKQKAKLAKDSQNRFSVEACSKLIEEIVNGEFTKFAGFNDLFNSFGQSFRENRSSPFLDRYRMKRFYNGVYQEVYSEYVN